MKTIKTLQNSDEWYEMRKNYLGASDSNIIMGKSKFMTPLELYRQKLGVDKPKEGANFIQAKGHKLEEKMRPIMEMLYDCSIDAIVAVSQQYDFLMASLDGYMGNGAVWENKFVGADDYDLVSDGQMLDKYYPQVQHQLMVTGAPYCVFTVIKDDKESPNENFPYAYAYIEVPPDYKYMENELLPSLLDFWECVQNKTEPGLTNSDVIDLSENEEALELLSEYQQVKSTLDDSKKKEDELKKKIFKLFKTDKAVCNGVKLSRSKGEDKESIDYKSFVKDSNFSVPDAYKKIKKGYVTKRITFPKQDT